MKVITTTVAADKNSKSCLMVGVFEDGELSPSAKLIDKAAKGHLTNLLKRGSFVGKVGQVLPLFAIADDTFDQVWLVGCGKADKLNPARYRSLLSNAIRLISTTNSKEISCYLSELKVAKTTLAWRCKQITEVAFDSLYRFDKFKSEKEPASALKIVNIYLPDVKEKKACELAITQGEAVAAGVTLTKNLANLPSNICTPTYIANQAKELSKSSSKLSIKVLDEAQMKKLGMGALLGVSQGSAEPPKLVCLEYNGGKKNAAPVVLVGKGVTFDTGGNSLKPADAMVGMKYDMCGAATVLGTIKAAALLNIPVNVVGLIPTVENMPGGSAYKPEDILTSMSGQTIEVISTDAEGRLILADALTYAKRYNPDVVIDIATLTGAVVIALGIHATGLITNHDPLAEELLEAGIESHDRAWQLPMWDEYQDQIKSPFADMANVGGRSAGSITAGCFLSRFANDFRWAHLDVAGTAAMMSGTQDRLATGRPVPMLVQYLLNKAK